MTYRNSEHNAKGKALPATLLIVAIVAVVAVTVLGADTESIAATWGTGAADWLRLLRPCSKSEVDAVRKTLLAIERASPAKYVESFEPEASFEVPLNQSMKGSFSEVQTTRLQGDDVMALVHVSALWVPSPVFESGKIGYFDRNIHVVKSIAEIEWGELIQLPIPLSGWFIAASEGDLPYDLLTEVEPAAPSDPTGKLAVSASRDGLSRIIVVPLGGTDYPLFSTEDSSEQQCSDYYPSWSPDGTRIAFVRREDTNSDGKVDEEDIPQVFIADPDGSNQVRLADNPGEKGCPRWSHDGLTLAFVSGKENSSLFMIDMHAPERLTQAYTQVSKRTSPAWSPVRKELAFSSEDGGAYTLDMRTSQLKRLELPLGPYGSPDWSPDGQSIVLARYPGKKPSELVICDLKESKYRLILPPIRGRARRPVWSPDGEAIAFFTDHEIDRTSYSDLWVIGADGSNPRRLTSGWFWSIAHWSSSGRYVAVSKLCDSTGDGLVDYRDDPEVLIFDSSCGSWLGIAGPNAVNGDLSWMAATH